jgi:hypothetical protein
LCLTVDIIAPSSFTVTYSEIKTQVRRSVLLAHSATTFSFFQSNKQQSRNTEGTHYSVTFTFVTNSVSPHIFQHTSCLRCFFLWLRSISRLPINIIITMNVKANLRAMTLLRSCVVVMLMMFIGAHGNTAATFDLNITALSDHMFSTRWNEVSV